MNFRASLACIICAFAVGCATELPPAPRGKATETKGLALAPFAIKEECLHLKPGDRLDYRFASDQPVQFNVHYHDGKLILTPLSRNDATGDVGIYDPQIEQDYCLMWEAGPQGATIDYRFSVRGRP